MGRRVSVCVRRCRTYNKTVPRREPFVGFVWLVVTSFSLIPAEGAARTRVVCIRGYLWLKTSNRRLAQTPYNTLRKTDSHPEIP